MSYGYSRGAGAYQQVHAQGGVETADPHGLVTLLMDGALERIRFARGCMVTGNVAGKGEAISKVIEIVGGLQSGLNPEIETPLVGQLADLYDYMSRRLLQANLHDDTEALDEVSRLLNQLRASWVAIPVEARQVAGAGA
ncbi:flagellar export chaperone FliS [Luteibacter sp. PPL201]|jgi:flagellar protein FliS|uniref:Flagellar secretion chaperone FliS n=1 Tax=Luteibacter sahnii TaxID=3021977 RepID=A0ABT6BAJ5_9GAMM|nr:flagellar export chaperone FliS [Luteibacter sp. PPL193]MDY1547121.1 flagellar export chaperone FliS [Luteibacter sp. PPL193]